MHYSLQEQSTPQKFSTLVDFMKFLKRTSSLKKVDSLPLDECSLCSNNQLDVIKIARSCKVSPYPCEGHECACFTQIETPSTHKDTPVNQTSSTSTSTSTSNNEADDESTKITSTTYTKDNASTSTSTTTQHQHSPPSIPTVTQYFPACFICTATVLYSKTNSFMRDNGRWRANCPFCKAEFCHLDFILASAPKRPPQPKPKSKVSSMKKKYSKNKIS